MPPAKIAMPKPPKAKPLKVSAPKTANWKPPRPTNKMPKPKVSIGPPKKK